MTEINFEKEFAEQLHQPQSQQQQQQQQSYQVIYSVTGKVNYDSYKGRQSQITGSAQIAVGILCIIVTIVLIYLKNYLYETGHGIFGGILFIVTGSFGLTAGKANTRCKVMTHMILCIVSVCSAAVLISLAILGAVKIGDRKFCPDNLMELNVLYLPEDPYSEKERATLVGLNAVLSVLALIEVILALWGSALGCKVICCGPITHQLLASAQLLDPSNSSHLVVLNTAPAKPATAQKSEPPIAKFEM